MQRWYGWYKRVFPRNKIATYNSYSCFLLNGLTEGNVEVGLLLFSITPLYHNKLNGEVLSLRWNLRDPAAKTNHDKLYRNLHNLQVFTVGSYAIAIAL